MMEGMEDGKSNNEDEQYKWQTQLLLNNSTESGENWRQRKPAPLTPSEEYLRRSTKNRSKSFQAMTDDHITKVLASLVPDEIIYNVNDYSHRHYDACLLFADVSGFTDLSEKYNRTGKGGPSRLTQVLNSYIGSMVQEILSHNGDVIKFSGDAFLCMWKSGPSSSMQDIIHSAIDCAIIIQKSFGTYETEVGVVLKVKMAISAGHVIFAIIGDQNMSHYMVVGHPIQEVKKGEKLATAGEVIISSLAWNFLNSNEYLFEIMRGGLHLKITGFGPNWRSVERSERYQKNEDGLIEDETSPFATIGGEPDLDDYDDTKSRTDIDRKKSKSKSEDFSLRPSVNQAAGIGIRDDLRKFILPPVLRAVELDEPIEYLTEMRQIVILFINIIMKGPIDTAKYVVGIDNCYKIVCKIVDGMQGCVNKVNLFDKDLMFVILFGLRGYKHELESQLGLKCASECHQQLNQLQDCTSVSVAVTTGMTYCGVVGHTLRREYTVISLTVNKAARLMVAYPDRVVCDRQTFLHSKMESKNFILQEHRELKGITNVGPVYEFREQAVSQLQHTVSPLPLLGRANEIRLYRKILDEQIKKHDRKDPESFLMPDDLKNVLLIMGDARQGKTRLLDELVFCTPENIPVNRFNLMRKDSKMPYKTANLIFSVPLGLDETSTANDREAKLMSRLNKMQIPELLCALNGIFNVGFEKSSLYMAMTDEQKEALKGKIMKQLCYRCFMTLWVIAIDDVEFIDDESWQILLQLIQLDLVLFVITLGSKRTLTQVGEEVLSCAKINKINLPPIAKWYHAGLACQILDVQAIPAELEKIIQSRSSGNPGWIESFLVSLIQAEGITIKYVPVSELNEIGLVTPPVDMIFRLTPEEISELAATTGDAESTVYDECDKVSGWRMYQLSYKDSLLNFVKEKIKGRRLMSIDLVPVCYITNNIKLEDIDAELSMDVMIIKTFDSLTSYEQLLLKASSIMGEIFPRDMLLYIMSSGTIRATALAVQKLFEIKVLGCAQGDFTQGDVNMAFRQRLINPNNNRKISCECVGLKIHESCADLPKYASCGYMRFRIPMFRETTYDLLTDNQKKEFHGKAIRYLEKETRRCRSCGNGFFVTILGMRNEDCGQNLKSRKRPSRKWSSRRSTVVSSSITNRDDSFKKGFLDIMSNSASSVGHKLLRRDTTQTQVFGSFEGSKNSVYGRTADDIYYVNYCLGIGLIRKLKNSYSVTKTFSYADFSTCQCPQILSTMYTQMLQHCKGAARYDTMMNVLLEYAHLCIVSCNIPRAIKLLNDALVLLDTPQKDDTDEELVWKVPLEKGKINTLLGFSRYELGQMEEAYTCFINALNFYGKTFPTSMVSLKCNALWREIKQEVGLYLFPNLNVGYAQGYKATYCNNLSECLSLMSDLFKDLHMWKHAEVAALWSLRKALQSDSDFYSLCSSYANVLEVSYYMGKRRQCVALECHALYFCHRKQSLIESQELKAVARLYGIIFCARLLRGDTLRAIHIGYVMLRISATIHAVQLSLQVLPLLIHSLLTKAKVTEAVTLMSDLEYCAEEDYDNSGWTWYNCMCMILLLETGYTLRTYKDCDSFYRKEGITMLTIRDPDAERCFYTVMWLWCVRKEEWETASIWYAKARDFALLQSDDSLMNVVTAVYLLEGLMLYLIGKIDKRNVRAVAQARKEISTLMKAVKRATKQAEIIRPRFYHLRAYFKYIKNDETKALSLLAQAKASAIKYENLLEMGWIEHSEKAWTNNLPTILLDLWKEHCEEDTCLDYHEIDFNGGKLMFYTLPTPLFT